MLNRILRESHRTWTKRRNIEISPDDVPDESTCLGSSSRWTFKDGVVG